MASRGSRAGVLHGISCRLRGGRPDPDVVGPVLADRIRSALGPLEKRLDVPRVHVMVDDHIALLHGKVASEREWRRSSGRCPACRG